MSDNSGDNDPMFAISESFLESLKCSELGIALTPSVDKLSCRSGEPLIVKSSIPEELCWVVWGSRRIRRQVPLFNKKTCRLVKQEDMVFWFDKRHVVLFNNLLVVEPDECRLVQQVDMSSLRTRRQVAFFQKRTCLLVEGDMVSG